MGIPELLAKATNHGISPEQAAVMEELAKINPAVNEGVVINKVFDAVQTHAADEKISNNKAAEATAAQAKIEQTRVSEESANAIIANVVDRGGKLSDLSAALAIDPTVTSQDRDVNKALQKAKTRIQEQQTKRFLEDPRDDATDRINSRKAELNRYIRGGILTPTQADEIINSAVEAHKNRVTELADAIENGLPEAEAIGRTSTSDSMRNELLDVLAKKARENPEIQQLATKAGDELMATDSMATGDIDLKIDEIRAQRGALTKSEEMAIRALLEERKANHDRVMATNTAGGGGDIFSDLRIDATLLPPSYRTAIIEAINSMESIKDRQQNLDNLKEKLYASEATAKEREMRIKQAKLFMKYFLPTAATVGLGSAGILALTGSSVWFSLLAGSAAGAALGGGRIGYKWYFGEGQRENLKLRVQAEEMRQKIDKIKTDASLRTLQQGYASKELLADILARSYGVDPAQMQKDVHKHFGTGDVKAIAGKISPQNFGFNIAA